MKVERGFHCCSFSLISRGGVWGGIICLTLHYFQTSFTRKGGSSSHAYVHLPVHLSSCPSVPPPQQFFEPTSHFQSTLTNGVIKSTVATTSEQPLRGRQQPAGQPACEHCLAPLAEATRQERALHRRCVRHLCHFSHQWTSC